MADNSEIIIKKLKTKACLKQNVFRSTQLIFEELKTICSNIADELNNKLPADVDENVRLVFTDKSPFEFRLKFSGDTLVFQMHSNVVTLPEQHPVIQSDYIQEDFTRAYFGSIRVYDFLSDTIKYNRYQDAGLLMARLLVNKEKHYHIESGIEFSALRQNIGKNVLNEKNMRFLIEDAIINAIEIDLMAPNYQDIQLITYESHTVNNMGDAGSKLGFQMSANQ